MVKIGRLFLYLRKEIVFVTLPEGSINVKKWVYSGAFVPLAPHVGTKLRSMPGIKLHIMPSFAISMCAATSAGGEVRLFAVYLLGGTVRSKATVHHLIPREDIKHALPSS